MTDTTQATDVASWLREVLKEHERLQRGLECDCDWPGAQHPEPGCPVFVLADVAAKRAIVDRWQSSHDMNQSMANAKLEDRRREALLLEVVRDLASAYAHRDGYREEWRP